MQILNIYYGQEAYDFEAAYYHLVAKRNPSPEQIEKYILRAKTDFQCENCHWYLIQLMDFNPYTGETSTKEWHQARAEKEKIVLNKQAKQKAIPIPKQEDQENVNVLWAPMAPGKALKNPIQGAWFNQGFDMGNEVAAIVNPLNGT